MFSYSIPFLTKAQQQMLFFFLLVFTCLSYNTSHGQPDEVISQVNSIGEGVVAEQVTDEHPAVLQHDFTLDQARDE